MKQYLFGVGIKSRETGEKMSLRIWAATVDAATASIADALLGAYGAYVWTGSGPVHNDHGGVVTREI